MFVGKLDLRPGGVFHYGLWTTGGVEMWGKFVYREVVAPERLTFVVSFSDKDGGLLCHPASATWPLEVLNTITLSEREGRTTLTMHGIPINATEEERATFASAKRNVQQGFKGTMDQLEAYLANAEKEDTE